MIKNPAEAFFLLLSFLSCFGEWSGAVLRSEVFEAEDAQCSGTAQLVENQNLSGGKGVTRNQNLSELDLNAPPAGKPDLVFHIDIPEKDRYEIRTYSCFITEGDASARYGWFSAGKDIPKKRLLIKDPDESGPHKEMIGKVDLPAGKTDINFWLPKGAVLDRIKIDPYFPEKVPEQAAKYIPALIPPPVHPRIWVTPETLPVVRERLKSEPNADIWKKVYHRGMEPLGSDSNGWERPEELAGDKAFVYLITGNETVGREAVHLIRHRLESADFVNVNDVTREVGALIYYTALVYDWCYPLMTDEERLFFHNRAFSYAEDMEICWPPFAQPITNTHGNEYQINRDLLAMAIACYDLDPVPYQYCAYRILEELVPMRRFQFESPRHDQGTSYASHRYKDELMAALLFQRMSGVDIFGAGSKEIGYYYLYLRLPGGGMLRDGDGTGDGPFFDKHRMTMFLLGVYSGNPLFKGEWERLGACFERPNEELLFLLLNDPNAPSDQTCGKLPTAWDSGPVLSSQILRTGWDLSPDSDDTVVEFKGGSYRFGNHQHADAGSFQIFRRGYLNADLGEYGNYGNQYDYGFAKRSVAHSVLLVHDPDEIIEESPVNDGGQRFFERSPWNAEEAVKDPLFRTGRLLASAIFPNRDTPNESFFCVNLTEAYSAKVKDYVRSLIWLKTTDTDVPVAVIVFDRVVTASESFRVDWQLNSLTEPLTIDEKTFSVFSVPPPRKDGHTDSKRSRMTITTLLPKKGEYERSAFGGVDSTLVDGVRLKPKKERPESFGWRNLITSNQKGTTHVFLHLLQIGDETGGMNPVQFRETEKGYLIGVAGRQVELSIDGTNVKFE